jgi:ubiquinone/menaquinone biosynthesis C-methylase UbiE
MTNNREQEIYWEGEHGFRQYDHPVARFFAQQRINYINTFLDLKKVRNCLDVGCGNGLSTFYMSKLIPNIYALDRSNHMLERHPLKGTSGLCRSDAFFLPFPKNSFELVYGWEVLHHVENPWLVITEMARVSYHYVLIAEPNRNNPIQFLFALLNREHRWVVHYSLDFLCMQIQRSGLKALHTGSGGLVFPNKTPHFLLRLLKQIPYSIPLGISNWVLAEKNVQG